MAEDSRLTSNRGRSRPTPKTESLPPESPPSKSRVEHALHMGLGDAVLRLIHVENFYMNAVEPGPQLVAERRLLVEALNQHSQIDLGMNCDNEGIPETVGDSVSAITHSARTSCCRIKPAKESTEEDPPTKKGRGFFTTIFGN